MKKNGIKLLVLTLIMVSLLINGQINVNAEEDFGSWVDKISMPTARYFLGVAQLNNKIYAIGGKIDDELTNIVEEYDPIIDKWVTKASMPTARYHLGATVVNGKIYAISGNAVNERTNAVEEYNPITDVWTTKASIPTVRNGLGIVTINDKIYAIGGYNSNDGYTNVVEEYDLITDKWTTKTNMPTTRVYLGVVSINDKIYAMGGHTGTELTNVVEEYDPVTDKWREVARMKKVRQGLGVVKINNKIYAIGGYTNDYEVTNTIEEYTPPYTIHISSTRIEEVNNTSIQVSWISSGDLDGATYTLGVFDENDMLIKENIWTSNLNDTITGLNSSSTYKLKVKAKNSYQNITEWYDAGTVTTMTDDIDIGSWRVKANMEAERFGLKAIEANNKIYSIGGCSDNVYRNTTEEYNPNTDVWTTKANMPTSRRFFGLAEYKNKIYAVGGFNDNGMSNKVEEYDIELNEWKEVSNMLISRHNLGVTAVEDKIYAIGGYAGTSETNIVEEYDIKTDTWITKLSMPTPRYGLEVIEANNKIYAIGGYKGSEILNIVEEYDIETNTWREVSNMPTERYGFAVEKVNNKIYVIGGISNSGSTNIVEEYDPQIDKWTQVASMPTVRYHIGAGEANNKIYVVGGYSSEVGNLNKVEEYTPPQAQNITLDVETDKYNLQLDAQFDVYVKIEGATNIYAQDIKITYDTKLFTLLDVQVINEEKLGVYHSDQSIVGEVRYILASKGAVNGISGTERLLKLSFKTSETEGKGDIGVYSGLMSDEKGIEITAKCLSKTFTVAESISDVNRDGRISIGDLAITANLYRTMSEEWGIYNPDADLNGVIEELDYVTIVDSILDSGTIVAINSNIALNVLYNEPIFVSNDNIEIYDNEGNVMFRSKK